MSAGPRRPLHEAKEAAAEFGAKLLEKGLVIQICGSIRRKCVDVGDIDIIYRDSEPANHPTPAATIMAELADSLDRGGDRMAFGEWRGWKINLFWIPEESWAAGLLFATGSGDLNKRMRTIAKSHGFLLNQYGLYRAITAQSVKLNGLSQNNRVPVTNTEQGIFDVLGLPYLPPENRSWKQGADPSMIGGKAIQPPIPVRTTVKSSDGSTVYSLEVDEDGNAKCSCPGFRHRGNCKHLAHVLATWRNLNGR
jgi:DNA polymerase/3'-5' exonuclease PolX